MSINTVRCCLRGLMRTEGLFCKICLGVLYAEDMNETEFVEQPLDGILDLHTFQPKEAASVVDEYLRACHEKGILEVKVIHGKGRGVLLRTVHTLLERHPLVLDFKLDTEWSGWGATIVHLKRNTEDRIQETEQNLSE